MGLTMNKTRFDIINQKSRKKIKSKLIRRFTMITIFLLFFLLLSNATAEPFLDGHFIVIMQGDDPNSEVIESETQLYALERYYFLIPWNETWVEVPVPKIANMEGMQLDHVVYVDSMGYIPGDYSTYWNQDNPPIKLFKDMTDMECCIADFYAWRFPENVDRNISTYTHVDTESEFIQYSDNESSDNIWNFSSSGLSMNPGNEYGNYISTKTIMGINITKVEMSWDVSAYEENISFFVSVDNGTSWHDVTNLKGEEVNFTGSGNELIWKINMSQDKILSTTPILENLWINVSYTPAYTELTLQLDYIIDRYSNKFEFVWDFYKNYGDGATPHTLVYTDKDHKLESEGIPLSLYETQTDYPTKDAYIYMSLSSGAYSPEASVTITKMSETDSEFPWVFLILLFIIIVVVVLISLMSRSRRKDILGEALVDEAQISKEEQAELGQLTHKKEGLLKAIKKLDSDFEEGLIDEDVYKDLKGNYKQKTIDVMKEIDAIAAAAPIAPLAPQPTPEEESLKEKKEKILQAIKKLDSDFKEGLLDEETYKELRDDYKRKAVEMAKELESLKEG
jgi:hypothetical protein